MFFKLFILNICFSNTKYVKYMTQKNRPENNAKPKVLFRKFLIVFSVLLFIVNILKTGEGGGDAILFKILPFLDHKWIAIICKQKQCDK